VTLISKLVPAHRRRWLLVTAILLIAPLLLTRARFMVTVAIGESMLPTIKSGQLLLVDKLAYRHAEPEHGDIVLAHYKGDLIIKRVVGLPGEEVEVKHGTVYLDGIPSEENHGIRQGGLDVGKGTLLEDDFATLGDNRAIPAALALHPIVARPEIVGKVVLAFGENQPLTLEGEPGVIARPR
jgi:signal peptidase I